MIASHHYTDTDRAIVHVINIVLKTHILEVLPTLKCIQEMLELLKAVLKKQLN